MNLAESLLFALKARGVQEIFGIPGDFALPLFKVIEESSILPLYTLSHEPAVGYAADAAARFHSKPSVAAVTYGAGAFNMVNPVAAAYAEKSPVGVISGGPGMADRATGLLVHHQAKKLSSQLDVFKEITCDQVVLDDPATSAGLIARALDNCVRYSRPVYIEVPRDRVFDDCEPVSAQFSDVFCDDDALAACADEILASLEQASSPVLLAGIEIRRFGLEEEVAELCQRLGIPVLTTFMGRGLLANFPVDLRGTYMGVAGDPELTSFVESSDGLFLLGVLLSDTNFGISEKKIDLRKSILACDESVSLGFHSYSSIPLKKLLSALNSRLQNKMVEETRGFEYPRGLAATNDPISPTDIATAVNDIFSEYGQLPIASDMGDCLFTAMDIEHTEMVAPGYYATMGYGVPAGLGVQAATGLRPIILVGDGAFQMTGLELLNCKRYGWNPIVLVFNNSSWEMLRAFQPESSFNDLDLVNFAAVADSIGGKGQTATTKRELAYCLRAAIEDETSFQLIDVCIERGLMSNTLTRFVDGFKRLRQAS